jgi:hypothetical protein
MLLSQKRLKVVLNPFAVPLDHKGRPCAHMLYDPSHSAGQAVYVSAKLHRVVLEKRQFAYKPGDKQVISGGGQQDRVDLFFEYDLEPIEIEDTRYHRKSIVDGVLVPADEATAKRVGINRFIPADTLIAKTREQRIAEWEAQHGEKPDVSTWKVNAPAAPTDEPKAPNTPKAGEK